MAQLSVDDGGVRLQRDQLERARDEWLTFIRYERRLARSTWLTYRSQLNCALRLLPEEFDLEELLELFEDRLSPARTAHVRRSTYIVLNQFFEWWSDNRGPRNPLRFMKPPQKSKYHRRALTREELALLGHRLREAGPKDRAMVMLVLFNGFRPIDVVNLLVEDVDFSGSRVRCRGSKGGSDDALPLSPTMATALHFYLELTGIRSSWVFTGPKGRMATRSIGKAWHRVCGPALSGLVLYQLRHSYAMELLRTQEGITLADLQKMLRHKDVRSTMWYVDSQDDRQQELMLSYDLALTAKLAG